MEHREGGGARVLGGDAGELEQQCRRVIIHIDLDCFYAQVEMVAQPELCQKPVGIQQKTILATSNYIARQRGVGKMDSIRHAKQVCPDITIIKGEILTPFRLASEAIFTLLKAMLPRVPVQRLGLDEFFLDITDVVTGATSCTCMKLASTNTPGSEWTCSCPYAQLWSGPHPERRLQPDDTDLSPCTRPLVAAACEDAHGHVRLAQSVVPCLPVRGGGLSWYGHVKGVALSSGRFRRTPPAPAAKLSSSGNTANTNLSTEVLAATTATTTTTTTTAATTSTTSSTTPTAPAITAQEEQLGQADVRLLAIGTHVAARLRRLIFMRLGFTSCAGIGHNKAVAKVAGELNKPNQQTCVLPWMATAVFDAHGIRKIPGIGRAMRRKLESANITTLQHIRASPHAALAAVLGDKEARIATNLARGIDTSRVTMTGKPKSLSNEDNIGRCTDVTSVVVRLEPLVALLLTRVDEDFRLYNRYPSTLRFSICGKRYHDRHSRQRDVAPSVFQMEDKAARAQRVVDMCMQLLWRMVKKPLVISVINVAATNFVPYGSSTSLPALLQRASENAHEQRGAREADVKRAKVMQDNTQLESDTFTTAAVVAADHDADSFQCDVCGAILPLFCLAAHTQFHSMEAQDAENTDAP
ncbi:hypothetical protein PTSG_11536 [Salpingoeca rosetta]|uniref:UmuC domain-containing protein n=1 Tax=Salpingoeca rosetta (strain ATCC 50818 / BSB-021) TaxID=946362 RepID=F2TVG6_SALR5|nr:uncharacterized protein PTSG_11536 [Salpingoeca rosetta]EGD72062.1 hypothetical protein PTSG_11536 [Salpingoeca rosetta]|eukprot:XP_004998634.1 hypothetical protein PTSG_11536 [Salpingoeca rosetta]